jgi:hypothetical protein
MATHYNYTGNIVADTDLILHLDAAKYTSYPNSGTTWYDISGYGHHATLNNGMSIQDTGYKGKNFGLDGSNDSATVNNNLVSLIGLGDSSYTLEAWIYVETSQGTTTAADSIVGLTSATGYGMQVGESGGSPRINYGARSTSNFYSSTFSYNTWTHVVLSRIAGVSLRGYLNGSFDSSQGYTNQTLASPSDGDLTVGYSGPRVTGYFDGNIPIVRIYKRGLTDAEILQNYNAQKSRYGL